MSRGFKVAVASLLLVGVSLFVYGKYARGLHRVKESHLAWSTDLKAALAKAAISGKPVMIDFDAVWCQPCQEYKRDIFPTAEFEDWAQKFELVEIDTDKQPKVATQFGVSPIPDIYFLNSKGQPLSHVVGNDGEELMIDMQKALDMAKQPAPAKPVVKQAMDKC